MRAHFNRALLDDQGNRIASAQVRLLVAGGTDPYGQTIYSDAVGGATLTNPWTTTSGEVDFYLDAPDRVKVGVKVGTDPEEFWDNTDVLGVGNDSTHPGTGTGSMQIGAGAAATALNATALGQGAQAAGERATALGDDATASQEGALAAGTQASASQPGTVALGQSALAQGSQSAAIGSGARALHDQGVAIGAGAATEQPYQIMLGSADHRVDVPGPLVLRSPSGAEFSLRVTDDGLLYTQELAPYEEPPPIEEGGGL
ncbi:hypothetical protein ACPCSE_29770 [Streptomyces cellulosae]